MTGNVLRNLDRGFFKAARTQPGGPRCSYGYLTDLLAEQGVYPSEDEVAARVTRLAQRLGISRQAYGELPESARSALEQYALDTYGLDKALAEIGIRVKGVTTDKLEKFFSTTTSTVLFPTYVESQVVLGMLAGSLLGSLVATETNIDSHVYESLAFTDVEADQQLRVMGEGAIIPTTRITTSDRSITLKKFGRMLEATYESLRLQRINVVSIMLQRIGLRIGLDETDEAIGVLILGDGNTDSAMTGTSGATGILRAEVSGTLDYDELTRLFGVFGVGYQMNTAVCGWTLLRTILNMAEFKDPTAGFTFQRTGALPGPMGADWHRWDSTNYLASDRILAIDRRFALEQVTEQGVMTETDRLIDRQIERTAITKWTGFAKMDYQAAKLLDVTY